MTEKESIPPNNSPREQTQLPHQPTKEEMTEEIMVFFTKFEKEYMGIFANILSKLELGNGLKVLKENNLSELIRTCVSFTTNYYMAQVFVDSRLIEKLSDKKAKKDFIAFRAKYMNFPIDVQLQQLKEMGLVKGQA